MFVKEEGKFTIYFKYSVIFSGEVDICKYLKEVR